MKKRKWLPDFKEKLKVFKVHWNIEENVDDLITNATFLTKKASETLKKLSKLNGSIYFELFCLSHWSQTRIFLMNYESKFWSHFAKRLAKRYYSFTKNIDNAIYKLIDLRYFFEKRHMRFIPYSSKISHLYFCKKNRVSIACILFSKEYGIILSIGQSRRWQFNRIKWR